MPFKDKNKEIEYMKVYHLKYKERHNELRKMKIRCECGSEVRKEDLNTHKQTMKHLYYIANK